MFLTRKIRQPSPGQPKQPLTRLKELPPEDRARVMVILRANTYEQAPPLVEQLVGFAPSVDTLGRFFSWQATQKAMETTDKMIEQVGGFLNERHPNWTGEKIRETASAFFTMQAMSRRDTRAFTCIAQIDLKSGRDRILAEQLKLDKRKSARKLALNRARLELDERKLALEAAAAEFNKNPQALELFQQARQILGSVK